jgi:hypothetical protein
MLDDYLAGVTPTLSASPQKAISAAEFLRLSESQGWYGNLFVTQNGTADCPCTEQSKAVLESGNTSFLCPYNESDFNGIINATYVYFKTKKTWLEAEADCSSRGGHLASATDQTQHSLIENIMPMTCDYIPATDTTQTDQTQHSLCVQAWIGLNDRDTEGTFSWTDGVAYSPDSFSKFGESEIRGKTTSEPNNGAERKKGKYHSFHENCVEMRKYKCKPEGGGTDMEAIESCYDWNDSFCSHKKQAYVCKLSSTWCQLRQFNSRMSEWSTLTLGAPALAAVNYGVHKDLAKRVTKSHFTDVYDPELQRKSITHTQHECSKGDFSQNLVDIVGFCGSSFGVKVPTLQVQVQQQILLRNGQDYTIGMVVSSVMAFASFCYSLFSAFKGEAESKMKTDPPSRLRAVESYLLSVAEDGKTVFDSMRKDLDTLILKKGQVNNPLSDADAEKQAVALITSAAGCLKVDPLDL